MHCPRKGTVPSVFVHGHEEDQWREGSNTCSWCGSLNPDWFMDRLEKGDVALGATDKGYKVYVENRGGEPIVAHGARKFYFPHLSVDQMKRFVELYNARKINFDGDIGFYVFPYFMGKAAA